MDPNKLPNPTLTPRRCTSEPRLYACHSNTERIAQFGTRSMVNGMRSPPLQQKLSMPTLRRRGQISRSSTFPLLPALDTARPQKLNQINYFQQESFKSNLTDIARQNEIKTCRNIEDERKLLRRRTSKNISEEHVTSDNENPTRKGLPKSMDLGDYRKDNKKDYAKDVKRNDFEPVKSLENRRRLSVITEKSTMTKTSHTLLVDLEDENITSTLPSVSNQRLLGENNNSCNKNDAKTLQEHLRKSNKQFDPLETKALLLSNWFQTLPNE